MAEKSKQRSHPPNSWIVWVVGIPTSLVVLVLFVIFVQPWGEPRESITSSTPQDGDFYDPSTDLNQPDSLDTSNSGESAVPDQIRPYSGNSQIVDLNLASWKPVDESAVPEDQLPTLSAEVVGRVLVELSSDLWTKVVGDSVQFSIPQQEVVLIGKLTKVDTKLVHTRILEGILEDGSQEYAFAVTLGDSHTYARINTSKGSIELVGTRTHGWLMESEYIAPDVDFSLPDHFVVDPHTRDRTAEEEPSSEPNG